jgi:hypothetical protein
LFESPIVIRPGQNGLTAVAERDIRWGQEIARFPDCEILDHPTPYTVQLSPFEHAYEPKVIALVGHSCFPNTLIDVTRRTLVATRDIPAGTAITRFYPSTEWILVQPFHCLCGAPGCIGEVRGAQFLEHEVLFKHYVSGQIREMHLALQRAAAGIVPSQRELLQSQRRPRLRLVTNTRKSLTS